MNMFIGPCAICGNLKPEVICSKVRDARRKVLRCQRCNLVYLEQPKNIKDAYAFYNLPYKGYYKQGEVNDWRFRLVKPFLKNTKTAIEIGCSKGDFLLKVKPFLKSVAGLELRKKDAICANRLDLNVQEVSLEEFRSENKFDIVFCFQTFEHMPDPNLFLSSLKRIIRTTSVIFIEVPNINDALLSFYRLPGFDKFYFKSYHFFVYSKSTLEKIFKKNNFNSKIYLYQRYSLTNHLHWIYYNNRQRNTEIGYNIDFPCQNKESKELFCELNEFYKKLLYKRGYADTLWAVVRPAILK